MSKTVASGTIDRMAIGLSGLCIAHCLLAVVVVAALSGTASVLSNPLVHQGGLALAVVLGAVALGQGVVYHQRVKPAIVGGVGLAIMALALVLPHGLPEAGATVLGVVLLATGHLLNRRALR